MVTKNKTKKATKQKNVTDDEQFGINDCHKPKPRKLKTRRRTKMTSIAIKRKPYRYKTIILFPNNLGQKKLGVEKAPAYLNKYVNHRHHSVIPVKNTGDLFQNIRDLYKANQSVRGKRVNIGGDHSMSIATIADTINRYPNAKVVYFDAHADINTYQSSLSKHYHGMPLSFVTGLDPDSRHHFPFLKNKLPFSHLLYIGSRCWDIFEVDEVDKRKIQFITPAEFNQHFDESIRRISDFVGNSPVHVSFDVDSIDPKYIPSTGTPVKQGLELNKAKKMLEFLNSKNVVNMDITELNMDLGSREDGIKSGKNSVKLFSNFLS
jgi:arginase